MTPEEQKEFDDLKERVRWLEIMSGNTRKKARESNPYDTRQGGFPELHRSLRKKR